MKRFGRFCLAIALAATVVLCQQEKKPLTNGDVVKMTIAGLAEDTILLAIQVTPNTFDVSPQALIELKQQQVSQAVLNAMLNAPKGRSSRAVAPSGRFVNTANAAEFLELRTDGTFSLSDSGRNLAGKYAVNDSMLILTLSSGLADTGTISGNTITFRQGKVWIRQGEVSPPIPNETLLSHPQASVGAALPPSVAGPLEPPTDSGVYYYDSAKWVKLTRPLEKGKLAGIGKRVLIGAGQMKMGVEFPGLEASMKLADRRPTFYVRTNMSQLQVVGEEYGAAHSAWSNAAAGNVFVIRLNPNVKNGSRELMSRTGTLDSDYQLRDHQVLKPSPKQIGPSGTSLALSLTLPEDLEPGQYVLSFGASLGFGMRYDFGIKTTQ